MEDMSEEILPGALFEGGEAGVIVVGGATGDLIFHISSPTLYGNNLPDPAVCRILVHYPH
jgi:hypothetical protein